MRRSLPPSGGWDGLAAALETGNTGFIMTGQWLTSRDGVRWWFDSGSLAFDFAYTGDFGYGVPEWEHLHGPDDLDAWLTGRFGRLAAAPDAADLAEALRLRTAISRIALALADGGTPGPTDIDAVNAAAHRPPPAPHLPGGTLPAPAPDVAAALSAIARDAVAVFGAGAARIRRCAAPDCALVFHDTSRPGTRRWCSMRRCGNRTKLRSHRSRTRGDRP